MRQEIKDENNILVGVIEGERLEIIDAEKLCPIIFQYGLNMLKEINKKESELKEKDEYIDILKKALKITL